MRILTDNKIVLLLTACATPSPDMYACKLQDPSVRKLQYIESLLFYLKNTNYKIVFVDNSGYNILKDLKELDNSYKVRLECLCFKVIDYDKNKGKGYGEMLILNYAFKHSRLICSYDYIVKITGRIIVNNIVSIISKINTSAIYGNLSYDFCCIGSVCFGAPYFFYKEYFIKNQELINDAKSIYFEHVLLLSTQNAIIERDLLFQQAILPFDFMGVSGTTGKIIKHYKIIELLKNVIKFLKLKCGYRLRSCAFC